MSFSKPDPGIPSRGKWRVVYGILCLALLLPLLLTDVPPLLDYPNHLARLVVLAAHGTDPILARFYTPHWGIIPDLAIDAIGPPLIWLLPVHVAGRIVIAVALLLPVFGAVAYSTAVLRHRSWWALGCGLVAYNATLMKGFLNFSIGLGVALWLAAVWVRWRDVDPLRTLLIAIPGTAVLFFCHLMALGFFALLIAAHELTRLPSLIRRPRRIGLRLLFLVPVFAVPAALYTVTEFRSVGGDLQYLPVASKAARLLVPFTNYILSLDVATAVLVGAVVVGLAATRRLWVPTGGAIALLLVGAAYLVAPFGYKGGYDLDTRCMVLFGFLVFTCLEPVALPPRAALALFAGLIALFLVRIAVLGVAWIGHNSDLADFRRVTASVTPGSAVFVTDAMPEDPPDYWDHAPLGRRLSDGQANDTHLAALLLIEHHAWWPFLFDNPSQQPLMTREPYRDMAEQIGFMPSYSELDRPGRIDLCGYDTVLLLHAGADPDLNAFATDRLGLIAASDAAALFRVRLDPGCARRHR